jgi:hypothetical protein
MVEVTLWIPKWVLLRNWCLYFKLVIKFSLILVDLIND